MNDQFDKLASLAGFNLDNLPDDVLLPLQSFTELIVKECLSFCEYRGDYLDEYDSGMTERARIIRESIQEHFGVK